MSNHPRLSLAASVLVLLAACSRSEPVPSALSEDLQADLARAGGGVQLAGTVAPRLEVVSDVERTEPPVAVAKAPAAKAPAAKARVVVRAPSANRGARPVVRSARRVSPAPVQAGMEEEAAQAEAPRDAQAAEAIQSQQRPQRAPLPSTQREPAGGWRTPSEIIRNAPFPIKPVRAPRG